MSRNSGLCASYLLISNIAFTHLLDGLQTQFLLNEHVQVVFSGHAFEVALAHAILLVAIQGLRHIIAGTLIETLGHRLQFQFGLEFCIPNVVVLVTAFVIQIIGHVHCFVPGAEPSVARVVLWRVQHRVLLVINVDLHFFVGLRSSVRLIWQVHFLLNYKLRPLLQLECVSSIRLDIINN